MLSTVLNTLKVLLVLIGTSVAFADCSDFQDEESCYYAGCNWSDGGCIRPDDADNEDDWVDECRLLDNQEDCLEVGCEWDSNDGCYGSWDDGGEEEDGPPECLLDCEGIEYINPEQSPYETCDWIVSNFGPNNFMNSCAEDCDDETMMDINEYVEACFQCLADNNCDGIFDNEDGENDCDPDLVCLEVLTCSDGLLYPTSCGPENCDEPIDTCDEGDDDGPPECLLDCPGIEYLGPDSTSLEICDFFVSAISTECVEDCDAGTMYELEYIAGECEECLLAGDCDGIFGDSDCSDLSQDECYSANECELEFDASGSWECVEIDGEDNQDDCDPDLFCAEVLTCFDGLLYPTACGPENCDEPIDTCDDGDDGPPECLLDCPGIEYLDSDSSSIEICNFLVSVISTVCVDDCDTDTINDLEDLAGACEECLLTGDCDDLFSSDDPVSPDIVVGDLNGDMLVNILDVITVVNIVLGLADADFSYNADLNSDGSIDITDVVALINIILGNGNGIGKMTGLSESSYEQGDGYIRVVADASIAGFHLQSSSSYQVIRTNLDENWIIKDMDGDIVIVNIADQNSLSEIMIEYSGNMSVDRIDVVGWDAISISSTPINNIPASVALGKAYPNPFNPLTEINLTILEDSDISLKVININGRLAHTLSNGFFAKGTYSFSWDASEFPSGIYMIKLESGRLRQTQKITLVK